MTSSLADRARWPLAGVVAGVAGLATSYVVASAVDAKESPVYAVGQMVIRLTPGPVAHALIQLVGQRDKPLLLTGVVVVLLLAFAVIGRLAERHEWAPTVGYGVLAGVGVVAVAGLRHAGLLDQLPVAVGFVTWLIALPVLTEPLRDRPETAEAPADTAATRRAFLLRTAMFAAGAAVLGGAGRLLGRGRRETEAARAKLVLTQVTAPVVPDGTDLEITGLAPWETSADDFYRIATVLVSPTILPDQWSLRIHGLVDRELTVTYRDLLKRRFTEAWVTICCVSNEVGGPLIGNAWWSGVRVADLLAEAGPQAGADAVLQTSDDGWTCGTPLAALTDDRNALLAVAMNGQPLPIDHGFPVRTIVPGLYGYVSATKWVVDMEVTAFDKIDAFWTQRGWSEQGPVKMESRVDVPRSGAGVAAGEVRFAGVAWAQHTGISAVEFAVDGGQWQPAELARTPNVDTWVQWSGRATVPSGDHLVRVRATDTTGRVQTSVRRDVLPNGATGWDEIDFTAR